MNTENNNVNDESKQSTSAKHVFFEVLRAVALVVSTSLIAALLIGGAWVVLGWMRFYGLETGVVAQATPLEITDYQNGFLNSTANAIDCYNLVFQGNSRFGSGLGLIAGACFGLLFLKRSPQPARLIGIAIAGAIVAGRFCLTFTSAPLPFLISMLIGVACFLAISVLAREPLPALPLIGKNATPEL
ncbi:MAG: hypothetical protein SGJ27_24530 [Candidatus Melainabacteria bacterium]|nr:hypothetical protein [Candidatus Melainabacteria bacterium]